MDSDDLCKGTCWLMHELILEGFIDDDDDDDDDVVDDDDSLIILLLGHTGVSIQLDKGGGGGGEIGKDHHFEMTTTKKNLVYPFLRRPKKSFKI
ncbi:hypothetical protein DERP_005611 [Dermatophagoides pteronyssinus]|uniref:Uncharacterized protein n=1 Tax=Dermatophagoides pteronyssinus TaxID=6956 RepID=A0ABQ8J926_DERPT|nr:hypothetical protein DERP_005611 [Dermatophagoides pteronyssinus]